MTHVKAFNGSSMMFSHNMQDIDALEFVVLFYRNAVKKSYLKSAKQKWIGYLVRSMLVLCVNRLMTKHCNENI